MFGVDGDVAHVGFAPNTGPVRGNTIYAGHKACRNGKLV
jgi:hypothetical protein